MLSCTRADVQRQQSAGGQRGDEIGGQEADLLGERQQQHVEEDHRQPDEQVLHRVHLARRADLQQEHRHECRGEEHHRVFRGAADELVEIDRHDEAHAERIGLTCAPDPDRRGSRIAARCAPGAGSASGPRTTFASMLRSLGRKAPVKPGSLQSELSSTVVCCATGAKVSSDEPLSVSENLKSKPLRPVGAASRKRHPATGKASPPRRAARGCRRREWPARRCSARTPASRCRRC